MNTYMNECVYVHVLLHAECGVEYCSVCSNVPEKCSKCSTGYILTDGVCGEFRFSGRGMQKALLMLINSFYTHNKYIPTEVQCKVENCLKCVETSDSRCNTCQSGYVMVNGQCNNKATRSDEDTESEEDNGLSDIEIAGVCEDITIITHPIL